MKDSSIRTILALVVLAMMIGVLAPAAARGEEVSAEQAPANEKSTPPLTPADVDKLIKQVDANQQVDADEKTKITELCKQALAELASAEKFAARALEFEQARLAAPERLARLKDELAKPIADYMAPHDKLLGQLEQELADAQAGLEAAKQTLAAADAEGTRRSGRRITLARLSDERARELAELEKQIAAAPAAGEPPERFAAARAYTRARILSVQQKSESGRRELQSYDATRELLPLERDKAAVEVKRLEKQVQALTEVVNRRRRDEAARQARLARSAAVQQAYPALTQIAEQNRELAEERAGTSGVVATIEQITQESKAVKKRLEQLKKQSASVRERIETVGLINAVAALLRRDRSTLPDARTLGRKIRQREAESSTTRFRKLSLDDHRAELADLNAEVERRLAELEPQAPAASEVNLESELRQLLETQREYLDALIADYDSLFVALNDLAISEQELIDQTTHYAAFIDEHILWTPNTRNLGVSSLSDMGQAATWLLDRQSWRRVVHVLSVEKRSDGWILAIVAASILPLVLVRRLLQASIRACGEQAAKKTMDRVGPTLKAFVLTLLLSMIWPGLGWLFAWRLSECFAPGDLISALAAGLEMAAAVFFPIELLRQACRPGGLAESHFDWPEVVRQRLLSGLRALAIVVTPAVVLVGTFANQPVEAWAESLGRVAFIIGMIANALFTEVVLRPFGRGLQRSLAAQPDCWTARFRYVFYPAVPLVPVALAVMAALGYYYTAVHLAWRLMGTLFLVLGLILVYALIRRWLLVTRRHLAIFQARERRAQAQIAADEARGAQAESVTTIPQDTEVDLSAINVRMSRLVRGIIVAAGIVGLWFVWVDVLPALGVLRQVTLWTTTVDTLETVQLEDETVAVRSVPTRVDITLADLGLALLVAVLALIGSRNVPAFIEIWALKKLPMEQGTRYAIATMSSYVISVVGIIVFCNILGIGWAKVQWLVAAAAVGLGFGLQEIFANLVSGLMIFIERPIRVGDVVTVDEVTGVVTRVRMRATTITNWDRKELIIPNKQFITGRVMNWTLSDQVNRIVITVGIAYDSDTDRAQQIMLQIAKGQPHLLADPAPTVFFEAFGESSLTLTLRAYLPNLQNRLPVIHNLHTGINNEFRKAGIEIAYPQRDLRVHFVDPPGGAPHSNGKHALDGRPAKAQPAA